MATSFATPVYPRASSRDDHVGYLRAGTEVDAERGPLSGAGCGEGSGRGWYALRGGGFVCVGRGAELATEVSRADRRRFPTPVRDAAMPVTYAVVYEPTVLFRRLPSADDERTYAPTRFDAVPIPPPGAPEPVPSPAIAPLRETMETLAGDPSSPVLRRMTRGMFVSLDRQIRSTSRTPYWRTQGGGFVRAAAVSTVGARAWGGVHLDESHVLPLAFTVSSESQRFRQVDGGAFVADGRLPRLAAFALTADAPVPSRGDLFYRTREGFFVRGRHSSVIEATSPPAGLAPGEHWVDVNLDRQALVAYEGERPVFATVVSTGRRGRGEANFETVRGDFRVEAKHRTTTMDGDTPSGGVYSIEDVPWVMYFHGSYALHGAFWHDGFGRRHSHGCVNLSPPDARWLFGWTEPRVPDGWHGAVATAGRPGTRVIVHDDRRDPAEGPEGAR